MVEPPKRKGSSISPAHNYVTTKKMYEKVDFCKEAEEQWYNDEREIKSHLQLALLELERVKPHLHP